MDDRTAIAIQNAAQVVKRATHVDVGNIDVPVLMCMWWLLETGPLTRRLALPSREQSGSLEHPQTLAGLTATTSASSIMNVSRRYPSSGFFR